LNTPLSVLLPVHNAQHSLAAGVADILDALPVWAERFELIMIDDGSTDDTAEVALELATQFPQVRVVRHPVRLGLTEAMQTGMDEADADVILVGNDTYQLDLDDLRALWRLRDTQRELSRRGDPLEPGPQKSPGRKPPIARLAQQLGFQMIERATFEQSQFAQAVDAIARVDSRIRPKVPGATTTPNLLERVKRLTLGH
jgi:hypothetical protein